MDVQYNSNEIITNLKLKLEEYSIDSKKLFELLKKYNGYIVGSFLLQSIEGSSYSYFDNYDFDKYDLNICILGKKNLEFEKEINLSFYDVQVTELNLQLLDIKSMSITSIYFPEKNKSLGIIIFYIDNQKHKNIQSFINLFDFNICRNYFDGNELYIENYENIKNHNATFTINKEKSYLYLNNFELERIKKYDVRGYKISIEYNNNKIYKIMYLLGSNNNTIDETNNNLIIIFGDNFYYYEKVLNNLPNNIEHLHIYLNNKKYDNINNLNLPFNLKEIMIVDLYNKNNDDIKLKLPFGCKLFIKK